MARHSLICSYFVLLSAIFIVPVKARGGELASLGYVNDLPGVLDERYVHSLEARLFRFDARTGIAIRVMTVATLIDENLLSFPADQFVERRLPKSGSGGEVLIVLDIADHRAAVRSSRNIANRFARSNIEAQIGKILQRESKSREMAVEMTIDRVLTQLDRWFYVFELLPFVRSPMAEMILLVFAPVLSIITGISLMAFTSAATLPGWGRFLVGGHLGICVMLLFTWIVRQPGGIYPGVFCYGIFVATSVTGLIGLLRPFWFSETFKGRQSGGWWNGPVHFRYG